MNKRTVALCIAVAAWVGVPLLNSSLDSPAMAQPAPPKPAYQTISFTLQPIHDITMGGVVSHTVMVPDGWTMQGQTLWSTGTIVMPDLTLAVASPDGASVAFIPRINASYTTVSQELNQQRAGIGLPPLPPTGVAPPQDVGQFLVDYIAQNGGGQMKLISQKRDEAMEKLVEAARQEGAPLPIELVREEHLIVTMEYDVNGVTMRQEIYLSFSQQPTVDFGAGATDSWGILFNRILTAPAKDFEARRPLLNSIARSVQPTAKWSVQRDAAYIDIQNARHAAAMQQIQDFGDFINRRAAEYEKMSDEQHAAFLKWITTDDKNHRRFLDVIMGVTSFKGADGSLQQFPAGNGRAFSNGRGGFQQSNDPNFQPPEGFTPMEPAY